MTELTDPPAVHKDIVRSETEDVLSVVDLSVEFYTEAGWVRVVDRVSLSVPRGQTVGLVGESGSGKTVTSLAVMGLLPRDTARVFGSIQLAGRELVGLGQRALADVRGPEMAMVFQEPRRSLNPAFTVGDQIAEVLRRHERVSRRDARAQAIELLERVGIVDAPRRAGDYPHQFSGGMCQRVMLAIALACKPRLLIADEPTTALDVTVQKEMLELMNGLQADLDVSILLITHDLGVVGQMCDQVNVMYAGQVVESAGLHELFEGPHHPYTAGLLAAIPGSAPAGGRLRAIPGAVPAPAQWPLSCRFVDRCGYAMAGVCDAETVELVSAGLGRQVRCARAGELALAGVH